MVFRWRPIRNALSGAEGIFGFQWLDSEESIPTRLRRVKHRFFALVDISPADFGLNRPAITSNAAFVRCLVLVTIDFVRRYSAPRTTTKRIMAGRTVATVVFEWNFCTHTSS